MSTHSMQKELYVVGGQQRVDRSVLDHDQQWYDYKQGMILRVNVEQGTATTCVEYASPPAEAAHAESDELATNADDVPVLFKAATLAGDRLYACTQTEIIIYSLPKFVPLHHLSLPCFNDVHHVRPRLHSSGRETLLVANTGLDMVLELTLAGEIVSVWNTLGEPPWAHFSREVDYRLVSTKPHRSHPNYVFTVGDDVWATRFEQKDAICLTQPNRRIEIGMERVHDGVLHNARIYFTTVDGYLVIANPETLAVEETLDLNALHEEDAVLGWCRSLWIEGDYAWVGFSRIRPTKFRGALSWVRTGFQRSLPTRIALYNLKEKRHVCDINTEGFGLNAVFSILPAATKIAIR